MRGERVGDPVEGEAMGDQRLAPHGAGRYVAPVFGLIRWLARRRRRWERLSSGALARGHTSHTSFGPAR